MAPCSPPPDPAPLRTITSVQKYSDVNVRLLRCFSAALNYDIISMEGGCVPVRSIRYGTCSIDKHHSTVRHLVKVRRRGVGVGSDGFRENDLFGVDK